MWDTKGTIMVQQSRDPTQIMQQLANGVGGAMDALEVIDELEDEAINPQRRTGSISYDSKLIIKKLYKKSANSNS